MGGYSGTLEMPSLPLWEEHEEDSLHKPLKAPANASTWKHGNDLIYWSSPVSYPEGISDVKLALLSFDLPINEIEEGAQKIYQSNWINLFSDYHEILVERGKKYVHSEDFRNHGLELYCWESGKNGRISYSDITTIEILSYSDEVLKFDVFREICELASKGAPPNLQYRMLIASYRAIAAGDYRKAIIEASSALEIALTKRITLELDTLGIQFGEKLLNKYRQLSGRFELAELLDIPLPKNYTDDFVKLRNVVVHRAEFPEFEAAHKFVFKAAPLLSSLTPNQAEDADKTEGN